MATHGHLKRHQIWLGKEGLERRRDGAVAGQLVYAPARAHGRAGLGLARELGPFVAFAPAGEALNQLD
jgi:hypothetical protein